MGRSARGLEGAIQRTPALIFLRQCQGILSRIMLALFVISFVVLGYLGTIPPSDTATTVAQIGTIIYFAYFVLMPWYGLDRGYLDPRWVTRGWPVAGPGASGLFAGIGKPWLLPHLAFLLLPLATWGRHKSDPLFARLLLIAGIGGLCWFLLQGFAIGLKGWQWNWLEAMFGSLERFTGILIEHFAGHFPLWIAPVQAVVATIVSEADDYAREVQAALDAAGLRAETDLRNEKINYKVREHSHAKVPVLLVVGKREAEERTVSVRRLGSRDQKTVPLDAIVAELVAEAVAPDAARILAQAAE